MGTEYETYVATDALPKWRDGFVNVFGCEVIYHSFGRIQ
jgi:hypothetical protein